MARISDKAGQNARMTQMLERLRQQKTERAEGPSPAAEVAAPAAPEKTSDSFQRGSTDPQLRTVGGSAARAPLANAQTAGSGVFALRLANLTGASLEEPLEPGAVRFVDGPLGKAAIGDVTIQSAADLERFSGIAEIRGDLNIAESGLDAAALDALSGLAIVSGSFSLEGNRALRSLEALQGLRDVGKTLYLGYNDALSDLSLPALRDVGRALIIEGNPALQTLALTELERVAGYLHVHENDALTSIALDQLATLSGELSILENPSLIEVRVPALTQFSGSLEIDASGPGGDSLRALLA